MSQKPIAIRMPATGWSWLATLVFALSGCLDAVEDETSDPSAILPDVTAPCVGVQVYPPAGFTQVLVAAHPAGTTFCLHNGTYRVPGTIAAKSYDSFIGESESGTVLDFTGASLLGQNGHVYGLYGYGGATGQHSVTVRNLTIQHCVSGSYSCRALKQGDNWGVSYVELRNNDTGGEGNCDHCFIHDNTHYGILVPRGTVSNSELARNGGGCSSCITAGDTGVTKMVQQVSSTWRNNYIHDNFIGIWCDGCWAGSRVLIEGNRIINNYGPGINFEISWGQCTAATCVDGVDNTSGYMIARNNTLKGNATRSGMGTSCYHAGQITVQNSQGVVLTGNTIDSSGGMNALCLVDTKRNDIFPKAPQCVSPFTATGNTFILAGSALVGQAGDETTVGCPNYTAQNIRFANNTYRVNALTAAHWQWHAQPSSPPYLTFTGWQGYGLDSGSTILLGP